MENSGNRVMYYLSDGPKRLCLKKSSINYIIKNILKKHSKNCYFRNWFPSLQAINDGKISANSENNSF